VHGGPEGRQLPHPAEPRRIPGGLQGLSRRSRPSGRPRALAVRLHLDNHEFSWMGWQSIVKAGAFERPGQSIKVAANQAWFEYIPARVAAPSGSLEHFGPPAVKDVPIKEFDRDGLGVEPNNLTAINSLKGYRSLRY